MTDLYGYDRIGGSTLTLEERERRAYIGGDAERAALYARAADAEEAAAGADDQIDKLHDLLNYDVLPLLQDMVAHLETDERVSVDDLYADVMRVLRRVREAVR